MQKQPMPLIPSDMSSVAALYDRYAPSIFAYLRSHTRSQEDAEDILLEVFLAALEQTYFVILAEQKQLAWLRQVARNKLIDYYRATQQHQFVAFDQVAEIIDDDEELVPEKAALRDEKYAQLRQMIQHLPASQQEVLRLRFEHGLRYAEIAEIVDKSEGSVRMLLVRALNYLRNIYKVETI